MKQIAKIKKHSTVESEYGTSVKTWKDDGKVEGYLDTVSISKDEQASKIVQDSTHIFITTDIVDVETGDRLEFGNRTYEINYVDNPMMKNHHLEIELKPIKEEVSQSDNHIIYYGTVDSEPKTENDIFNVPNGDSIKERKYSSDIFVKGSILVIAYPKVFGKSSIRLNNKLVTNWKINELMVNGVPHYVYSTGVTGTNLRIELF